MAANSTATLKCVSKKQIEAVKSCTIKIKNNSGIHTFSELMSEDNLIISFKNCFLQENIKKGILVDLCKYIAQCSPSENFSLDGDFVSEVDNYEVLIKAEYDGNKLNVSISTGYLGESDLDLECECAYLGEIEFDFDDMIPDFFDLDYDEIKDLKCVICNDENAFSSEIKRFKKRNAEVLNEHDFIKKHIPRNLFMELYDYDDIEYADERVSMRTKDAVYKIDANGKWRKMPNDLKTSEHKNRVCNKVKKLYTYKNKIYNNAYTLICDLEADGLVIEVLDYGRSDRCASYYVLASDNEIGEWDYQIEEPNEFIDKFAEQLGVEIQ